MISKQYYANVIKSKLEARTAEELNDQLSLPILTALFGTTLAGIVAMIKSS